jgi:hypothetical protein
MANIDKKFVVKLQGKEFVTYEGLLDVAHQMELKSIETELIQIPNSENGNQCIVKAVVKTEDGKQFEGYGDASPNNVNKNIAPHLIRMAETRAKARALRDLTNIGMTALEELGDSEEVIGDESVGKKKPVAEGVSALRCSECNIEIPQGVAAYSKKNYGKFLCMNCQKKHK